MQGALSELKVLDLTRLLPGSFCSMLLADLGADVIKVEDVKTGDYARWWSPKIGGNSVYHVVLNRNKRSITLNLKSPEGKVIFEKLAAGADVVLEGFRPGIMAKLGLDYECLEQINPRLIFCSISGYGASGIFAHKAGHDVNYLALNGVLSYSGKVSPTMAGVQIADVGGGGLLAAFAIMAALFARERLGRGQFVDISMTDGSFAWNCMRFGKFVADHIVPKPGDYAVNHGFACYNIYLTKDERYMSIGAIEPQFWKAFCQAAGQLQWDTPHYFEPGGHQKELIESLSEFFRQKSMMEWVEHFKDVDCCCEPILNLDEAMKSELMKERAMVVDVIHESWGIYRQLGIAPKFSLTPGSLRFHAPGFGEHTRPILEELGYTGAEIGQLKDAGIV